MYFIAIAVTVLLWKKRHSTEETWAGLHCGTRENVTRGLQTLFAWVNWRIKFARLGSLLLGLLMIIHFCPNGSFMEKYDFCCYYVMYLLFHIVNDLMMLRLLCLSNFVFQLTCGGSCAESPDEISPIYSLWATFIGLYIANYVVERSTGWAFTHALFFKFIYISLYFASMFIYFFKIILLLGLSHCKN